MIQDWFSTPDLDDIYHNSGVTVLTWPHHLVFVLVLFNSQSFLLVHICQHETDVGSEQVIHFVAQGRLAEQLGAPHQVPDGHVEVGVATGPVGDPCEGMSYQNVLQIQSQSQLELMLVPL